MTGSTPDRRARPPAGRCRPRPPYRRSAHARGHLDDRALRVRRGADARGARLSEMTASVLVRRGYADPEAARRFLAARSRRTTRSCSATWRCAVERIRAAIAAGERICVHGDYDVDGICATALAVLTLRELGADVDWHLPSRFEEGYGVSRRHARAARRRGLRARAHRRLRHHRRRGGRAGREGWRPRRIVTDHHRPGEALPDCPIVATGPSDYPFPELCGTGVVYKLAQALGVDAARRTSTSSRSRRSPTSCRSSTRTARSRSRACARSRARRSPGLRALMRAARVDPAAVDAAAVGFRLAPRINAAGRLGRPDAALELLLTDGRRPRPSGSPTSSRR